MKLNPILHPSTYVFCQKTNWDDINRNEVLCAFREKEGWTLILQKDIADKYSLPFIYKAAWISLQLNSDLDMVGLTALFSKALSDQGISSNVVAAYSHDHIFVAKKDAHTALQTLRNLEI